MDLIKCSIRTSGIYKISSIIKPVKFYIGSSINVYYRKHRHICDIKKDQHANKKMQNHFNKYGIRDLKFEILCTCPNEYLIKLEQWFMDTMKPTFNIRMIAESNLGCKHPNAKPHSAETRRKMVEGWKAAFTEETRRKISDAAKRRRHSQSFKDGVSKFMKGNKYAKGSKRTKKFKEGVSSFHKGRKRSSETILNIKRIMKERIKPVIQLTIDGKHIKQWDGGIREVQKSLNINKHHISSCCNGKRNSTGGYKWKHVNQ